MSKFLNISDQKLEKALDRYLSTARVGDVSDTVTIASALRSDEKVYRKVEDAFIAAIERASLSREILSEKLGVLLMQYGANKQGIFFKSANDDLFANLSNAVEKGFDLATKINKAAPEYTPKQYEKIFGSDGRLIGVMCELIPDAVELSEYLDEKKGLILPEGIEDQLVDYASKIHKAGLMQGDFNTENILISNGRLKVVDPLVRDIDIHGEYTIAVEQEDVNYIVSMIKELRRTYPKIPA